MSPSLSPPCWCLTLTPREQVRGEEGRGCGGRVPCGQGRDPALHGAGGHDQRGQHQVVRRGLRHHRRARPRVPVLALHHARPAGAGAAPVDVRDQRGGGGGEPPAEPGPPEGPRDQEHGVLRPDHHGLVRDQVQRRQLPPRGAQGGPDQPHVPPPPRPVRRPGRRLRHHHLEARPPPVHQRRRARRRGQRARLRPVPRRPRGLCRRALVLRHPQRVPHAKGMPIPTFFPLCNTHAESRL